MPKKLLMICVIAATTLMILSEGVKASDGDQVRNVDVCQLALSPQEYSGQLIKVSGMASFNFEESALVSPDCGVRLWIEVPDKDEQVNEKPPAGTRAIFGVSFEQFSEWEQKGALSDPSALPWQTAAVAPQIKIVQNKRWRQFNTLMNKWGCQTPVTLVARVDYLPRPGFITPGRQRGFVWQISGYGHMDSYPLRLVVAEVVELGKRSECKK